MSFVARALRPKSRAPTSADEGLIEDGGSGEGGTGARSPFSWMTPVAPPAVPKAPTLSDDPVQKAAEEERRRRASAGRASTILTGPLGVEETSQSSAKILLGAGY